MPVIVVVDRHLLRLREVRAGRHADRPGAGAHLPRRAVRGDQRERDPRRHRPRLEQAALSLGATPRGTFFQVTLPLIRPGVLVGALFAFITSFDELIVALFLSGQGAVTLPRRMWEDLRYAIDPTIAAVSTFTIVLTALLLGVAHILRKRAEQTWRLATAHLRSGPKGRVSRSADTRCAILRDRGLLRMRSTSSAP